jgi:hypothetical protein
MPQNVLSNYSLYDTIGVTSGLSDLGKQPSGWFSSFAQMGNAGDLHLFDVRNRSDATLPYNNQDARDLMPYGFRLRYLSVSFVAPAVASELLQATAAASQAAWSTYSFLSNPIWQAEMPQHCGIELKINTDIHLKTTCAMCGSAAGLTGGGFGGMMLRPSAVLPGMRYAANLTAFSNGTPELENCWAFSSEIMIPTKAAVSVIVKPSEWARQLLRSMQGPGAYPIRKEGSVDYGMHNVVYLLRVGLHGVRQLQQRGEYHA